MATFCTRFHSTGSKTDITNAYVAANAILLTGTGAIGAPEKVPVKCELRNVVLKFATRAGGAATLTFYLSRDSVGDIPLTDEIAVAAAGGYTTAAKGGGAAAFEPPFEYAATSDDSVAGTVYLHAKWNAGTGDVTADLYGRK